MALLRLGGGGRAGVAKAQKGGAVSAENNKALIRRFYEESAT